MYALQNSQQSLAINSRSKYQKGKRYDPSSYIAKSASASNLKEKHNILSPNSGGIPIVNQDYITSYQPQFQMPHHKSSKSFEHFKESQKKLKIDSNFKTVNTEEIRTIKRQQALKRIQARNKVLFKVKFKA